MSECAYCSHIAHIAHKLIYAWFFFATNRVVHELSDAWTLFLYFVFIAVKAGNPILH